MKKIIAFTLILFISFTNFSFALNIHHTANFFKKQALDKWGILALYSYGSTIQNKSFKKIHSGITIDYENYILRAIPLGINISKEARIIAKSQKSNGKFADYTNRNGDQLLNAHIWGIISLYAANYDFYNKAKALSWLKANQNKDGGFPIFKGNKNSDLSLTAMAIIAYSILGLNAHSLEVHKALNFIENNLNKKESCETIALYILAKTKLGLIDYKLYKKLLQYQLKDGSFKPIKNSLKNDYMATSCGLLALSDYKNKISIFTKLRNIKRH